MVSGCIERRESHNVDTQLYAQAFGVYLAKYPDDPGKAAQLAKDATRVAFEKWREAPPEKPKEKKEGK